MTEGERDRLTASYLYPLPQALIAHQPADKRDQSRLMVVRREGHPEDRIFHDLPDYLRAGDCLVLNDTRVIPARLFGKRAETGGRVEILLLAPLGENRWRCLVKPGKNARPGQRILIGGGELVATVEEAEADGSRLVAFDFEGDFMDLLNRVGQTPLPPYIREKLEDPERYQTVYASEPGSAAAPTAGLHFTPELLRLIESKGVKIARLTLHVGLGTFRPVKEEKIEDHPMHREPFILGEEAVRTIESCRKAGGRVIAVGTTSCRVLEGASRLIGDSTLRPLAGETDLFIYPGFQFQVVDALITNFHLPGSTLLMLVSALMGRKRILEAYRIAVEKGYRFFSFGDAMLLLP